MYPTTPRVEATTATVTPATLRHVWTDLRGRYPEHGSRWDRAAMIVTLRDITPALVMGWDVPSECDPSKSYWVWRTCVGRWVCTCKDFEQRGGPCKHALAVRLLKTCDALAPAKPGPLPFPSRTLTDDEPIPYALTDAAITVLDAPAPVA